MIRPNLTPSMKKVLPPHDSLQQQFAVPRNLFPTWHLACDAGNWDSGYALCRAFRIPALYREGCCGAYVFGTGLAAATFR